jgi:SagB-type dehydrogenase family enzyme
VIILPYYKNIVKSKHTTKKAKEEAMNVHFWFFLIVVILLIVGIIIMTKMLKTVQKEDHIPLDHVQLSSTTAIEEAISNRRSIHEFKNESLLYSNISQILWAAQGITDKNRGLRAAPSAGALYPLELYVIAGDVGNLASGVYKYRPDKHALVKVSTGDKRINLAEAAADQNWIHKAPASIVICAVYERTAQKYKEHAERFVHMEVGAVAENIALQCISLEMATVFVGVFDDNKVRSVIDAAKNEVPMCVLTLGKTFTKLN